MVLWGLMRAMVVYLLVVQGGRLCWPYGRATSTRRGFVLTKNPSEDGENPMVLFVVGLSREHQTSESSYVLAGIPMSIHVSGSSSSSRVESNLSIMGLDAFGVGLVAVSSANMLVYGILRVVCFIAAPRGYYGSMRRMDQDGRAFLMDSFCLPSLALGLP